MITRWAVSLLQAAGLFGAGVVIRSPDGSIEVRNVLLAIGLTIIPAVSKQVHDRRLDERSLRARLREVLEVWGFSEGSIELLVYTRCRWRLFVWSRGRLGKNPRKLRSQTPYIAPYASDRRAEKYVRVEHGIVGVTYGRSETHADLFKDESDVIARSQTDYNMTHEEASKQRANKRAIYCIPLWAGDTTPYGVMYLRSTDPKAFDGATSSDWIPTPKIELLNRALTRIGREFIR